MSKVDAQRAMREARYAALEAQASTTRRAARDAAPARDVRARAAHDQTARDQAEAAEVATPAAEMAQGSKVQGSKVQGTKERVSKERGPEAQAATTRTGAKASRSSGGAAGPVTDSPIEARGLCGHRNIGNKSCQRPAGHAEKNHRYK
jgi:hypothetical protein